MKWLELFYFFFFDIKNCKKLKTKIKWKQFKLWLRLNWSKIAFMKHIIAKLLNYIIERKNFNLIYEKIS